MRPKVGRSPVTPQTAEGLRIEPLLTQSQFNSAPTSGFAFIEPQRSSAILPGGTGVIGVKRTRQVVISPLLFSRSEATLLSTSRANPSGSSVTFNLFPSGRRHSSRLGLCGHHREGHDLVGASSGRKVRRSKYSWSPEIKSLVT